MAVILTALEAVIFVPPLAAVYQPSNVCPGQTGTGRVPYVESYVTVLLVCDTVALFPFSSAAPLGAKLTVYVFGFQCAYKVIFDERLAVVFAVMSVPPLAAVYQPAKL